MRAFVISSIVIAGISIDSIWTDAMIHQLGDKAFRRREIASKALEVHGERSLMQLREAANESPDPEIRYRADKLIHSLEKSAMEKDVKAIKDSNLSAREKGTRLLKYIRPGMDYAEVKRLIGSDDVAVSTLHSRMSIYPEFSLSIDYNVLDGARVSVAELANDGAGGYSVGTCPVAAHRPAYLDRGLITREAKRGDTTYSIDSDLTP